MSITIAELFPVKRDYPWLRVYEEQPPFTDSADLSLNNDVYNDRTLNTYEGAIPDCSVDLANNTFTLCAGTFRIQGTSPTFDSLEAMVVLRDSSDTILMRGVSSYCSATGVAQNTTSTISGTLVLASTTTVKVSSYPQSPGGPAGISHKTANLTNVYTDIYIEKVDEYAD